MQVTFFNNKSPNNSIAKNLETITVYQNAIVKESEDLYNIEMILNYRDHLQDSNYFFVGTLNRYYYIDIFSLEQQRVRISGHVDVLQTYRTQIEKCKIIAVRNENKSVAYLNDEKLPIESREMKFQIPFPIEPLSKDLCNILITAGGVA